MPPQYSSISSRMVMPAGASFHARVLHAARDGEAAEALALAAALRREPVRAFFDDVADPVHGLDVLLERRAAEEADLRDIRRAVARQIPRLPSMLSIIADSSPQI
jgi:hypothetical protein